MRKLRANRACRRKSAATTTVRAAAARSSRSAAALQVLLRDSGSLTRDNRQMDHRQAGRYWEGLWGRRSRPVAKCLRHGQPPAFTRRPELSAYGGSLQGMQPDRESADRELDFEDALHRAWKHRQDPEYRCPGSRGSSLSRRWPD